MKLNYDKDFRPAYLEIKRYLEEAHDDFYIALEKNDHLVYRYEYKTGSNLDESYYFVERMIKALLWIVGGYKVYLSGNHHIIEMIKKDYQSGGARKFDYEFMEKVYGEKIQIIEVAKCDLPQEKTQTFDIGGKFAGCRIGFDAGGSDRKVSAVIDGNVVFSEEVVWFPKINADYKYHYEQILSAFKTAASKMPRVDAIGVSSAGIYVNNQVKVASLFLKIPENDYKNHIENIYIDVAREIGNAPLIVANDGDVTALSGAINLKDTGVLGIAMGTSEAAGYINVEGKINGWLSELAFVPVDYNPLSLRDEWSGDVGCGVKYFSQDGVIKLAEMAGIVLEGTPAEKLKFVQKLVDKGDDKALKIFEDIGIYLGHSLAYYSLFFDIKHLLILGRVTSGRGGEILLEYAKRTVDRFYPELKNINLQIPDEESRRVGQAVAAASL